jgi:hypothetical protein
MTYGRSQQVALALVPKFSASIGLMSSCFLVSELIRDHRANEGNPIKRILLGVTCYEVMDAFGWWLSSWMVPRWTEFAFASGTRATCSFQGFLLQMALGAPINNGILTYFFYLVVKYKFNAEQLRRLEWKMHACVAIFVFSASFALLGLGIYNPTHQICWINGSPPGCGNSTPTFNPDVPCDRGDHAYWYGLFLFYIILWCVICLITYWNLSMRQTLLASHSKDVQWVTTQALFYSLAFLFCWFPSTLWSFFNWTKYGGGYWIDILAAICEPSQGLCNMLIFIRNRPESRMRLARIFRCQCWSGQDDDEKEYDTNHSKNNQTTNTDNDDSNDKDVVAMENDPSNKRSSVEFEVHFPTSNAPDNSMAENVRKYA